MIEIGSLLKGRYRLESLIGQGGMGQVFGALDQEIGQRVAVKLLAPRPGLGDHERRFRREFRALSALAHPHVVSVHDFGQENGTPFFVMEYVEGGDLRAFLHDRGGRLSVDQWLPLAVQLCQALAYIHNQGVVHRDLKPENVLLAGGAVKLTDFGLAQLAGPDPHLTQAGELLGTMLYMAPEQARGQVVDRRADLYALGILFYEVLTGRHPFPGGDPVSILVQHLGARPTPPRRLVPLLPEPWERLILCLMAKEPADRLASAEEVLALLRAWSDSTSRDDLLRPYPARVEMIFRAPLVAREAEMGKLQDAAQVGVRGQGPVVMVRGEAGVGKTRLIQELAAAEVPVRLHLLLGKSYEAERLPYQPFVEILEQCSRQAAQSWQDPALLQPLVALLPDLAGHPTLVNLPQLPAADAEAEKLRLFHAVRGILVQAAGDQPLLLCLDDLQWADAASLELFAFLARVLLPAPILLCATYRSEEVSGEHPVARLQRQIARQNPVMDIELSPLDQAAVRWMVGAMFGDLTAAGALSDLVYDESEGNPFFAEEIVKALVEEEVVYRAGGQWQRRDSEPWLVPAGVRDLLEQRLGRLGEVARNVVALASVVGRQFDFDTVRVAGALDEDTLLDVVDELLRARVIREDPMGSARRGDHYDFGHDKMREVAYAQLSPSRRVRLHRRVAQALEQVHAADADLFAGEVARHYELAGDLDKAVAWAERAGQVAEARLALEESLDCYRRAVDLAGRLPLDPERHYLLLVNATNVATNLGRQEWMSNWTRQALALAESQIWPERRWSVLYRLAAFYIQAGDPARSEAVAVEMLALSQELHDETCHNQGHLLLGLALKDQGHLDEARSTLLQALEEAERIGSHRIQALARRELGNVLMLAGDMDGGLAEQEAALALLRQFPAANPSDLAFTLADVAEGLALRGDYARAAAYQAEALTQARQAGFLWPELSAQGDLGYSQLRLGLWGQARRNLQAALNGHRQLGERLNQVSYALGLAEMDLHLGDPLAARDLAAEALALAMRRQAAGHETMALATLALAEAELGNQEAAQAYVMEALHAAQADGKPASLAVAWSARGRLALARGNEAMARQAAEQLGRLRPNLGRWQQAEAQALRGLALGSAAELQAAWQATEEAGHRPARWQVPLALARLHTDEAEAWRQAAEAEIEAVAASLADTAQAQALRQRALGRRP